MAPKISEYFSRANTKTRVLILVGSIIAIGGIFFVGIKMLGGKQLEGAAKVASAPSLQSVPGGQLTPEYYRALMKANAQTAQQAQMTGSSAVPTLVNVPQEQSAPPPTANCTVMCPDSDAVTVTDDINALLKDGKLSQAEANQLLGLANKNVPVSEYASYLNDLVKSGKLTPEQARKLLETYKKQHANNAIAESARTMDALIKSGQVPLEVGAQLLALQKNNVTPAEYEAELNKLVREGKISPAVAAQLLAQYTQQKARQAAEENSSLLMDMVKSGQLSPEVADKLLSLQARNVPVADYAAELNRLVAEGKITPAMAAKLLAQYSAQRSAIGPAGTLNKLVTNEEAANTANINNLAGQGSHAELDSLERSGQISHEDAAALLDLQKSNVSPEEYNAKLDALVKSGKISAATAAKLRAAYLARSGKISPQDAAALLDLQKSNVSSEEYGAKLDALVKSGKISAATAEELRANYNKLHAMRAEASKLIGLQNNNASVSQYGGQLSHGVQTKVWNPETAAGLLQQYQALVTNVPVPPPSGVSTVDTSIPGAENFAILQQRLAQQQASGTPIAAGSAIDQGQFLAAEAAAEAEAAKLRQERIQNLMSAMSGQAQSLISSWQAPTMSHKAGGSEDKKKIPGALGTQAGNANIGKAGDKNAEPQGPPLIKAGSILFAILTTAVDSDYPDTPVMATIVSGEFKGAVLLGKLALATGQDKVSLNFNLFNKDSWDKSKTVNAFAIDPDTARTVLASNVDHHYMLRYGTMFASSFVTGYANGISQSGSTTSSGIFGTSSTHPQLSPGEKIAIGLGQVGTTFGNAIATYVNTPATVKVNSGVALGILFMSDVT
jgi:polyhydroxyalkanoate synthesis regulator phasin